MRLLYRLLAVVAVVTGLAVGGVVIGFLTVAKAYRMPSSAMEPTLQCARPNPGCTGANSDRILVLRLLEPNRGDVIAFRTPEEARVECGAGGTFVKRIIGLPGDTWSARNGTVFINGRRLREPYIRPDRRDAQTFPPERIPSGRYFVQGDNRGQSCDSRVWGVLPRDNIVGEVVAVYWPPSRISLR